MIICTQQINATDSTNLPTQIQTTMKNKIEGYYPPLAKAANALFWLLASIELVLVFGMMALRQELEFGGIMAQLVKIILIFGLFHLLLLGPGFISKDILDGFQKLGSDVSTVNFDSVLNKIFNMWNRIWEIVSEWGLTGVGNSILLIVAAFGATIAVVALIGIGLMYYVFALFSIYVGLFFFAFAALSNSRHIAINTIFVIIRYGAKWMMSLLMMGIAFSLIDDTMVMLTPTANTEVILTNIVVLFVIAGLMLTVGFGISGFIDSFFSGNGGGDNNRGLALFVGGAQSGVAASAGGIAGAMAGGLAAADTIKAARASGTDAAKEAGVSGVSSNISKGQAFKSIMSGMAGGMMSGAKAGNESGMYTGAFAGGSAGADKGRAAGGKVAEQFGKDLKAELAAKTPDKGADKGASGTVGSGSKS